MVNKIISLTGSGMRDWLIQRITAVLLAVYILFLMGYLMLHSPLRYEVWHALFSESWMRVFTFLAALSVVYHTWVGMWTVYTDYIKYSYLRLTLHVLTVLALLACLVWSVIIVWGL